MRIRDDVTLFTGETKRTAIIEKKTAHERVSACTLSFISIRTFTDDEVKLK